MSAAHEGLLIPIRTWFSGGGKADATFETSGASRRTLLMHAAANAQESVADLLLKRGAQVDLQDSNGTTALLEAAQRGHVQVMDLLLKRGAEVGLANNDGVTALTAAMRLGKTEAAHRLMSAIESNREAWVQSVLDRGIGRVNAASMRGRLAQVPRCGAAEKAELARREEAADTAAVALLAEEAAQAAAAQMKAAKTKARNSSRRLRVKNKKKEMEKEKEKEKEKENEDASARITIKGLVGRFRLRVDLNQPVIALKRLIAQREGVRVKGLRLTFFGTPLENCRTLSDYNIVATDSVDLLLRNLGGARPSLTLTRLP